LASAPSLRISRFGRMSLLILINRRARSGASLLWTKSRISACVTDKAMTFKSAAARAGAVARSPRDPASRKRRVS
jgi:hypothetical protein